MDEHSILDFGNLYRSNMNVRKGCKWKDGVALYSYNNLKNTYRLKQDILNGKYKMRDYNTFIVTDPKVRVVMATNIRDRQFQDSLCKNGLYDQITNGFIRDSFACQKGKGMADAMERMEVHLRRYFRKHGCEGWVLKCDIHHFFDETRHDVAKAAVAKRVHDPFIVDITNKIIDSFDGNVGIGLGSPVSQLLELAVLDDMDHYIKERLHIKHYLRYMDDFILIHHDKAYLQKCLENIKKMLADIGLSLNKKTALFPLEQGIIFLKRRFYLTETGHVVCKASRKSITKMKRKLRRMRRLVDNGTITLRDCAESFLSWAACVEMKHAKANTKRRRLGKRAWKGDNAKTVERMRDYFKAIYSVDPYTVQLGHT